MHLDYIICNDYTVMESEEASSRGIVEYEASFQVYPEKDSFYYEAHVHLPKNDIDVEISSNKNFRSDDDLLDDLLPKVKKLRAL